MKSAADYQRLTEALCPVTGCYGTLLTEELTELFDEVSPMHYLSADAPPVLLTYGENNHPRDVVVNDGHAVHHPRFGILLKEQMKALGIECLVQYPGFEDPDCPPDRNVDGTQFFLRHFGM
ncbi:MAG: hypothetical protein E4H02_12175 [Lentisphaerales bacterium]|nr:MAG: hypothetical protein E4H02_12175 [Lentisphaerales bacterium]